MKLKTAGFLSLFCAAAILSAQNMIPGESSAHTGGRVIHRPPIIISPTVPIRNLPCNITKVMADVRIKGTVATTTLDIMVANPTSSMQEAVMLVPVPPGAVVKGLDFKGKAPESTAVLMPKEDALRDYRQIVAQMRDPAIMEFINCGMIRTSVFPVEPKGTQRVRIVYEQILPQTSSRVDYILPRSESLEYKVPWEIRVVLEGIVPGGIFSPSHEVKITEAANQTNTTVLLSEKASTEPGAFILSYTNKNNEPISYLYPDPKENGGFFLLAATAPNVRQKNPGIREVVLVLDRSGSMRGGLMEQVKEAAKQSLASLNDGDYFNVIVYNESVDVFNSKTNVRKDNRTLKDAFDYIDSVNPSGGTNIHDALVEALRLRLPDDREKELADERIPVAHSVIFLTDGLPTIGQIRESTIREAAAAANKDLSRRIFTFGVGTDVNVPLLDKIAQQSRGKSTYVLPKENIEVKVASITSKLEGPYMKNITVTGGNDECRIEPLFQQEETDLYSGEQLVVTGTYKLKNGKDVKTKLQVSAYAASPLVSEFNTADASVTNAFVARIHASRRIAALSDAVREFGINGVTDPNNPKVKELIDEIVRLSLEYGILSEYTAFFAGEGSLDEAPQGFAEMRLNVQRESHNKALDAQKRRSGNEAVSYSINMSRAKNDISNRRNEFMDADLKVSEKENRFQQLDGQSMLRNGSTLVQGSVLNNKDRGAANSLKADEIVNYGTKEYDELVGDLVAQNRQNVLGFSGELLIENKGKLVQINNIVK